MRKFLRILLFALVLTSTFSGLFAAPAAHALDTSYSWADEANILNSRDYRYSKLGTANTDGTYDYVRTQDNNVCIESITARKTDHGRGVLHHEGKKDDKGVCKYTDTNIDIGDVANYSKAANTGKDHDGKPITEFENNHKHGSDCGGSFFSALKLVICPVLTDINKVIQWTFDNIIKPFLKVTPLDTNSDLYKSWSAIRSVTNVFFVLVFLFIIFGNAFGIGVDAYTFKKALPRLVLAVVAVQASFFICGIAVDIGNVLGDGVAGLLSYAGDSATASNAASSGATALAGSIGIGAGVAASVVLGFASAAWPFILLAFLGFLVAMVIFIIILCARTLIIYLLILVSPLAFLAWVLPSTSTYFKKWKDNFVKIIAMYPLVVGLLAVAQLISRTSTNIANQGGLGTNFVAAIMALFAPMIAMFMMPRTFKWGGDLIGKAADAINKQGQKVQNRVDQAKDTAKKEMYRKNAENLGNKDYNLFGKSKLANTRLGGFAGRKLGQGLARAASGNTFSFGATGRRKIASDRAAAQKALRDQYNDEFARETPTNASLGAALMNRTLNGKKMTGQQFQAGMDRLMANGGWPEYAGIYQRYQHPEGTLNADGKDIGGTFNAEALAKDLGVTTADAQQIWSNSHSGSNGANAASKGFNPKGFAKFKEEKAAGVSSYEGARAEEYVQYMVKNGHTDKLLQTVREIAEDSTSRTKVSDKFVNALVANKSALAGMQLTVSGRNFTDIDEMIREGFISNGGINAVTPPPTPAAPTPPTPPPGPTPPTP